MRKILSGMLVVIMLLTVVTSSLSLPILGSSLQLVREEERGGLLGQYESEGIIDNGTILFVPPEKNYTLDGVHMYSRFVNISGTLYVTDYNGTGTEGSLELWAPVINITGTINATGRGWRRNEGTGHGGPLGSGVGGGYGGRGGNTSGFRRGSGGPSYGNPLTWEIQKGSGGADGTQYPNFPHLNGTGGDGGGSIVLNGDIVIIEGEVTANGGVGRQGGRGGGGGSGGGIFICGDSFAITGTLSVEGGDGGSGSSYGGGGGGGGRIKIFWSTLPPGIIVNSTLGGSGGYGVPPVGDPGMPGTCIDSARPPKEEVMVMTENVNIFENGSCQLNILMNASSRRLSDIYSRGLGFNVTGNHTSSVNYTVPESIPLDGPQNLTFDQSMNVTYDSGLNVTGEIPVNSSFCNGTRQQQLLSLGINITEFINVTMCRVKEEVFLVYVNATAEFLEKNKTDNNWTVSIGPPNWNMSCDRANFVLTQIGFIQQMLGSYVCEQTYNSTWVTHILLPPNATLNNYNELFVPPKNWNMTFGNGTYMNAAILEASSQQIVLMETMRVTEKLVNTTEPEQLVEKAFLCYKVFNIEYSLSNPGSDCSVNKDAGGIDDFRWSMDLTIVKIENLGFGLEFPVYDKVNVGMDVNFSLEIKAHVGFKTRWFKLRRFEAYLQSYGSIDVNFTMSVNGTFDHTWEQDIFEWTPKNETLPEQPKKIYVFWAGPIPVVVRPLFHAIARLNVNVTANMTISFGAKAEGLLRFGAGWEDDDGFYPIFKAEMNVTRNGPDFDLELVDLQITPSLGFRPTLLFYETLGPFAELEPYAKLHVVDPGWNITVGINLNVGIELSGWVKKITGLEDYSWTIWNWVLWVFPGKGGVYDVAVKNLTVANQTFINENLTVSVHVENVGDCTANVNVTLYYKKTNSESWTLFGSQNETLTTVYNYTGSSKTFVFNYNTSEMDSGEYTIKANASILNEGVSDANMNNNALNKTIRLELRNVRIVNVTTSKTVVYQGQTVDINATVENNGTTSVSVLPVFVYYKGNPISDVWCEFGHWIFDRENGTSKNLTFTWDTTGVPCGNYNISANAALLPYETNTTDNDYTDGWVVVTITGDVNGDGKIGSADIILIGLALFSNPGDPDYNPNADLNGDGKIGAADIIVIGDHLFEMWP